MDIPFTITIPIFQVTQGAGLIIHALYLFKEIKNIKILLIFIEGISDNNYTEIEEYKI